MVEKTMAAHSDGLTSARSLERLEQISDSETLRHTLETFNLSSAV